MDYALLFLLIAKGARFLSTRTQVPFRDAVQHLIDELRPDLPAKADGTPFTDDEIHEAADRARAAWRDA